MSEELSYEQAEQLKNVLYVDVRSPKEYEQDHIPGCVNIPILDDEQRKIVGILYKHEGKAQASRKGVELVLPTLQEKIDSLRTYGEQHTLVLYCWRGGLRSKSVVAIARLAGLDVCRLQGGYKAYRRYVNERLRQIILPQCMVLYGLTGSGKTDIIQTLDKQGVYTIDLEGLANHRGSVFGSAGLGEQPSQKWFESCLLKKLETIPKNAKVLVEGESRRIGKLFVPEQVFNHLFASPRILVYDTLQHRASRIVKSYTAVSSEAELIESVRYLGRRLGKKKVEGFIRAIQEKDYRSVVEALLKDYYDPLYKHPSVPSDAYLASVCSKDIMTASHRVKQIMEEKGE